MRMPFNLFGSWNTKDFYCKGMNLPHNHIFYGHHYLCAIRKGVSKLGSCKSLRNQTWVTMGISS
jgi:hypothetical protein